MLQAEPHVDGRFVVLNGDNIFVDGIGAALEQAAEPEVDATLLVEEATPEAARETGVVEVDEGQVTGLVEKPDEPPSRLATTGCYVLPQEVFAAARLLQPSASGEYEVADAVGVLARVGATVETVRHDGERCNLNAPGDIERVERLLK